MPNMVNHLLLGDPYFKGSIQQNIWSQITVRKILQHQLHYANLMSISASAWYKVVSFGQYNLGQRWSTARSSKSLSNIENSPDVLTPSYRGSKWVHGL